MRKLQIQTLGTDKDTSTCTSNYIQKGQRKKLTYRQQLHILCIYYIVFLDTLSVIARSIGEETFAPIAKECADFGMGLLNSVDDPDLRRCV